MNIIIRCKRRNTNSGLQGTSENVNAIYSLCGPTLLAEL